MVRDTQNGFTHAPDFTHIRCVFYTADHLKLKAKGFLFSFCFKYDTNERWKGRCKDKKKKEEESYIVTLTNNGYLKYYKFPINLKRL